MNQTTRSPYHTHHKKIGEGEVLDFGGLRVHAHRFLTHFVRKERKKKRDRAPAQKRISSFTRKKDGRLAGITA